MPHQWHKTSDGLVVVEVNGKVTDKHTAPTPGQCQLSAALFDEIRLHGLDIALVLGRVQSRERANGRGGVGLSGRVEKVVAATASGV